MIKGRFLILILGVVILGMLAPFVVAEEAPRITKDELKASLNDPDVVILDVRTNNDWDRSGRKIKGAVRENPKRFKSWAHKYSKDKTIVLYCS
jgi:rhodanese-related sulfurtransferase